MNEFFEKYDSIVVIGNYRFGSSALCNILHNFVKSKGIKAFEWSEYLSINKFIVDSDEGLVDRWLSIDLFPFEDKIIRVDQRPIPRFLVKSKLDYFNEVKKKNFVIFKISVEDFYDGNDELIEKYILNNDRVFKLGLNRFDVDNAIVSHLVGEYFNFWNSNESGTALFNSTPVVKARVEQKVIAHIFKTIVMHNTWLFHNHKCLNQIVWHHELDHLNINEMGLTNFSESKFAKNPVPHRQRTDKYFTNSEEVLKFTSLVQKELEPLISSIKAL